MCRNEVTKLKADSTIRTNFNALLRRRVGVGVEVGMGVGMGVGAMLLLCVGYTLLGSYTKFYMSTRLVISSTVLVTRIVAVFDAFYVHVRCVFSHSPSHNPTNQSCHNPCDFADIGSFVSCSCGFV